MIGALFTLALLVPAAVAAPQRPEPGPRWFYLRDGALPTADEALVEVLAVGDVMLGRDMADAQDIFAEVADELQGADLTIGNLEGAIGTRPVAGVDIPLLLSPEAPAWLAAAGFDLLSLANNHGLDAGPEGLVQTRACLRKAGIEPIEGGGPILRRAGDTTFAFVGWNDIAGPAEADLLEAVRQADSLADQVIVLIHWGQEYRREPDLIQRETANLLLAAGADVVLGSHPHVAQPVEIHEPVRAGEGAGLVAYSLGNFVFDQGWGDTRQGLALRLLFDAHGLRAAQALPLWTALRPRWMEEQDAAVLLQRVLPARRTGFRCSEDRCWEVLATVTTRSGTYYSGAIDLTGDGIDEIVRRDRGQVLIFEAGEIAWRSPPDWRVLDLALGDPNDDGRFEAMLAIERTAPGGTVVSQPFVIGYRGGTYRDLWGGSPVHSPLLEVELGDVDGDGTEELIVLESSPDLSERYLTVWRWHGWGFGLVWRSPPGAFHDLVVAPSAPEQPAHFSVASP